ncbi:MAG: ChbG/HpnK family deacetylase [Betaproteobacteria bacterium]
MAVPDRVAVKRLIVTADDVGLHRGMTLGAVRAHREGIVTACSVAAAGRELEHAADVLSAHPDLDVGVHLMLVGGRPVSDASRVPSLVTRDGTFAPDHRAFLARYALGRISLMEVESELRAQIERLQASGLTPCHLNGHEHLHVLPGIFDIITRLAVEYGVPYVRIPDDHAPRRAPSIRRGAIFALGRLAGRARTKARAAGLRVNDRTIGVADAGHLTAARLCRLMRQVSAVTELVTHPGIDGAQIGETYGWAYDWDAETDALCDRTVRQALAGDRIDLIGIRAAVV